MFTIDSKNNIRIVKGDTALIDFKLDQYYLKEGDIVYFTVKSSFENSTPDIQVVVDEFIDGKAKIQLTSEMTKIEAGNYYYDLQVSLSNGIVDTVIGPARFKVINEVTTN